MKSIKCMDGMFFCAVPLTIYLCCNEACNNILMTIASPAFIHELAHSGDKAETKCSSHGDGDQAQFLSVLIVRKPFCLFSPPVSVSWAPEYPVCRLSLFGRGHSAVLEPQLNCDGDGFKLNDCNLTPFWGGADGGALLRVHNSRPLAIKILYGHYIRVPTNNQRGPAQL